MNRQVVLFNSLGRKAMEFTPIEPGLVRLYTCGPTVYDYAHVGNLRTYIFEDVLRRTLTYFGYEVHHVMNITDVGHLTSDADSGEDKMMLGARRQKMSVWEVARFYEEAFFRDAGDLNVLPPHIRCRATEHVPDIINFIELILKRGYAYVSGGNVYFSVDRFPSYGELALLNLDKQRAGARIEVDPNKRNPFDFVLWFTESKFPHQEMKWDSPWGVGFPGWHIECSAMATKYLGEFIDIHCGGVDHIPVHHTNEIAQSEAALGHRWVNYWLHGEFLVVKSGKMSKSKGKFVTLSELKRQGFSPTEYRYLCLGTHYRMNLDFGLTAMQGVQNALENLKTNYLAWLDEPAAPWTDLAESYREEFSSGIADDLNTPRALAAMWKMARDSDLAGALKRDLLTDFDKVLALGVSEWQREELPEELLKLITLREDARKAGRFSESDQLRDQLLAAGVAVKDTPAGTKWHHTRSSRTPKE